MSETAPRPSLVLLARYGENILWLARYMERIENMARLLDVTRTYAQSESDERNWQVVLRINSDLAPFRKLHDRAVAANVLHFYLLARDNPTSIPAAMHAVRENARTLRALISTEMWLQINVMHSRIAALTEQDLAAENITRLLAMLKEGVQSHSGITEGTFYRDQSWCFYMLGRHLERADQTTRLLDTQFQTFGALTGMREVDEGRWHALLRDVAGYHAYRRVHPYGYSPPEVVAFLLLDGAFPRSVALNLAQLDWHLNQLRTRFGLHGVRPALERVDTLRAMLSDRAPGDLVQHGLSPFLDTLQTEFGALYEDIAEAFFRG